MQTGCFFNKFRLMCKPCNATTHCLSQAAELIQKTYAPDAAQSGDGKTFSSGSWQVVAGNNKKRRHTG
jgi:hypothetical protein